MIISGLSAVKRIRPDNQRYLPEKILFLFPRQNIRTTEKQEEYKKRHDELWPEMRTALREHGVIDYSIYLDPSISLLFGYLVIEDEKLCEKMANTSINQKWWKYMEDIMETNPDASPVSWELMPVFEL